MQCNEVRNRSLAELQGDDAVSRHVASCELCRAYVEDLQLRQRLALLEAAPEPEASFIEAALSKAVAEGQNSARRHYLGVGSALVASLLLFAISFNWIVRGDVSESPMADIGTSEGMEASAGPEGQVVREINVVLYSAESRADAMVAVELWGDIELDGYPGEDGLSWKTSLLKGANLLKLPVRVLGRNGGKVFVSSAYGGKVNRVEVDIAALDKQGNIAVLRNQWAGLFKAEVARKLI